MSQNRKIAAAAVGIAILSFSTMFFFLNQSGNDIEHLKASVTAAHGDGHGATEKAEEGSPKINEIYERITAEYKEPIFITNAEGLIGYSDQRFCDLVGADCENIKGDHIFDRINEQDLRKFLAAHAKLMNEKSDNEAFGTFRFMTRAKESLVLFSAYPVLDDHGEISNVIFVVKDLSEQVDRMIENKIEEDEKDKDRVVVSDIVAVRDLIKSKIAGN